jgi:hypothetical protein
MINVKTGIVFEGNGDSKDFSYTTLDDVRISLAGLSGAVGIKIGNDNVYANLYNAFIKACVWIKPYTNNGSFQRALEVHGQLKFSLVNLEVEQPVPPNDIVPRPVSGQGVVISSGATVWDNQSFLLVTLGLDKAVGSDRRIADSSSGNDIKVFSM